MKPIHVKRLKKLIAFLRKLPRKRFNFAIVRNEPPKCGAVGCAIGYMPNVFPRVFKSSVVGQERREWIGRWGGPVWTHEVGFRKDHIPCFEDVAMWVSGLEENSASNLFTPGQQSRVHEKLEDIPEDATPKQVAAMLDKFIKLQTAK